MSGMITRAAARAFSTEALNVVNNVAKQQFIVSIRGLDATLAYEQSGKNIVFVHTDVPSQFQGKGVGKLLAKHAFDYAQHNNLGITCKCHFLANYYKNNYTHYKDLKVVLDLD